MNRIEIGDNGAVAIAKAFQDNAKLGILTMWNYAIQDAGAVALANILHINRSLQLLDVRGISFASEASEALQSAAARKPNKLAMLSALTLRMDLPMLDTVIIKSVFKFAGLDIRCTVDCNDEQRDARVTATNTIPRWHSFESFLMKHSCWRQLH